ncbi:hypothetical protein ABTN14_20060 [Acinetobacter baumannii]
MDAGIAAGAGRVGRAGVGGGCRARRVGAAGRDPRHATTGPPL